MRMLIVNDKIQIADHEFKWTFVRSGGPGGQNVNKVASKAVLRWNVTASPNLPEHVGARLRSLQRRRLTREGDLVITSQRFRDQERNREDCLEKLRALVLEAATLPRLRRPTRPSRSSREARLREKKRRSALKTRRQLPREE